MKVSIDDKNKIVEKLKEGVSFQIIIQTAPEFLTSHKGKYGLTNGYLRYLQKTYITHIFNEKDSVSTSELILNLSNSNKLQVYLSKFPGTNNKNYLATLLTDFF